MSEKVLISKDKLINIANAVRERAGIDGPLKLDNIPSIIRNIPSGGSGYEESNIIYDSENIEYNLEEQNIIE